MSLVTLDVDAIFSTPLSEINSFQHHGVKGMKWGVRKEKAAARAEKKLDKRMKAMYRGGEEVSIYSGNPTMATKANKAKARKSVTNASVSSVLTAAISAAGFLATGNPVILASGGVGVALSGAKAAYDVVSSKRKIKDIKIYDEEKTKWLCEELLAGNGSNPLVQGELALRRLSGQPEIKINRNVDFKTGIMESVATIEGKKKGK